MCLSNLGDPQQRMQTHKHLWGKIHNRKKMKVVLGAVVGNTKKRLKAKMCVDIFNMSLKKLCGLSLHRPNFRLYIICFLFKWNSNNWNLWSVPLCWGNGWCCKKPRDIMRNQNQNGSMGTSNRFAETWYLLMRCKWRAAVSPSALNLNTSKG